jgi:hypothetical protein
MVFKTTGQGRIAALPAVLIALSAVLWPGAASAQLLYCCEVKGSRTCGDSLPPKCIGRPYTVRGQGGKLIRNVAAPLTPQQLKAKAELEKRQKEEEAARKEQARLDSALLATYSSVAEIDKGRERAEKEFLDAIAAAEERIAVAEKRKRDAIGDPELYRKRGMPDDLKRKVQNFDFEIQVQTDLIESKKKDLEAARAKFALDRQRYVDLKERSAARR